MRHFLIRLFYHPILFFFLLPIFYIALGGLFSIQYQSLNILSLGLFYLFSLINQMLENILLRIPEDGFKSSKKFLMALEIINVLLILYFGLRHSWIASLVLIGFTLIIQLQFLFSYYNLNQVSALIINFFKIFLLNGFAFYISASFMHTRFIPYFSGLFLPFYLYEASRMKGGLQKKYLVLLTGIGTLIGIGLLWQILGTYSFILLISLPFAWLLTEEYNRKTTAIYSIVYSFLYIGLLVYHFI